MTNKNLKSLKNYWDNFNTDLYYKLLKAKQNDKL